MKTPTVNVWKSLSKAFPPESADCAIAAELFREYELDGFLHRPVEDLLSYDLTVVIDYFHRIVLMHSSESPILRRRDTRWMSEFDYTLFNIRATGVGDRAGDFLRASMLLSTLTTQGVILAPVTKGPFEDLEHLESHVSIRAELANVQALNAGISSEMQMLAFCQAAHCLKLVIGFEMGRQVDPLAAVVLHRPELFLWTKKGRFIADEAVQNEIRKSVKDLAVSIGVSGKEHDRNAFQAALSAIDVAPRLSRDGRGRVPLALKMTSQDGPSEIREDALNYWNRIFDYWRSKFGFDFLVLRDTRSARGWEDEVPDLPLIRRIADAARKSGVRKNIGIAAEGLSTEVENFGIQGVDLVLIGDALTGTDRHWFQETFKLDALLHRINLGRRLRFSVPLEVNPGEEYGHDNRNRALLKRFIARFLGIGPSRRPLWETMCAIEGAWGYRRSVVTVSALGWEPCNDHAQREYHIENVATSFQNILQNGAVVEKHVDNQMAWWGISAKKGLLIAVASVENKARLPLESFTLDCSRYFRKSQNIMIIEHDFRSERGVLHLSSDMTLTTGVIAYGEFRLYVVTPGS